MTIDNNPIQTPPLEIAHRGPDAIWDYFRQLDAQGAVPLYEAKILVVGEPGAGKTSLIGKLFNPDFRVPDDTRSTLGIQIHRDWCFPLPKKPEISFKAHLWDFGGQEIQYLTHQFFLQSRSLFLLVIENRKDHDHADYWFQILSLLGQGSPVLVVFNERDGVAIDNFDLANYRRLFDQMPILDQSLNLTKAPDARFEAMRQLVQEKVSELKQIGQPIPRSWLKVRGTLETSKQKKLAWSEFAELCREEGLTEAESQRNLAIYLHDLGALVFFHDDPELSQSLFLDPQWLADAVYAILGDKSLKESNGRFSKEWMFAQWRRHGIEGGDCNLLLRLMLKNGFELCYPLEGAKGQEYLAPQLLKNIRPELPKIEGTELRLRFHYKFMPKGIIARLIVLLADDLAKDKSGADLVWRRGFVLARPSSKVHALVEEIERTMGDKAIDIRLWGPPHECQDLLSHIHELLRGIHKRSFAGLELQPRVPVPNNSVFDISLSFIRSLQMKGVKSHYFEGSEEPLEIAVLLQGISLNPERAENMGEDFNFGRGPVQQMNNHQTFHTHLHVESHANAQSQASASVSFQLQLCRKDMQNDLSELEEGLTSVGGAEALREQLAKIKAELAALDPNTDPNALLESKPFSKIRRFLGGLSDTGTQAGKAIKAGTELYDLCAGLARNYNKVADLTGLPQVPKILLGGN